MRGNVQEDGQRPKCRFESITNSAKTSRIAYLRSQTPGRFGVLGVAMCGTNGGRSDLV